MEEFNIEFSFNEKKTCQKFKMAAELYEIYVYCAKEFKCGLFTVFYNGLNLNFIKKNTKLNSFVKPTKIIPMKIILQKENIQNKEKKNFQIINRNSLAVKEGKVPRIILNEIFSYKNFENIKIKNDKIQKPEIFALFLFLTKFQIHTLSIPIEGLSYADSVKAFSDFSFHNLQKLSISGPGVNTQKSKIKISNTSFEFVRKLKIKKTRIEFSSPFGNLKKIVLKNVSDITNRELSSDWTRVKHIELKENYTQDLYDKLEYLSKKKLKVNFFKLVFDSYDLETVLDIDKLFGYSVLSGANEVGLKIKSRMKIEKDQENSHSTLSKISQLYLSSYSMFTEKELKYFENNLPNLKEFRLTHHNISNKNVLNNFILQCPKLEKLYIEDYLNPASLDIMTRLKSTSSDIVKEKIFSKFSEEKLEKIKISCIEFDAKKRTLTLYGDLINDEKDIDESLFILMKKIIFASQENFKLLKIVNFSNSGSTFLKKILSNFVNVVSSSKIENIKLINVNIDNSLIENFSFIFFNSKNTLKSLEINELTFENEEVEFLFYSLLLQIDYKKLDKLSFKNLTFSNNIKLTFGETKFLNLVKRISFESIQNFNLMEEIAEAKSLKGIELKNVPVTYKQVKQLLYNNGLNYEWLSFDLDVDMLEILSDPKIELPNLIKLKVNDSFEILNTKDNAKTDFLFKNFNKFRHLQKFKVFIKNPNKDKVAKICNQFKYLKNFTN